jgi:hypothetical protein
MFQLSRITIGHRHEQGSSPFPGAGLGGSEIRQRESFGKRNDARKSAPTGRRHQHASGHDRCPEQQKSRCHNLESSW